MECIKSLEPLLPYLKPLVPFLPYLKPVLYQLRPYNSRVQALAKGLNDLRKEQNKVEQKVKEEEIRHGRAIEDDVINWLKAVDEIISEYESFNRDEDHPLAACSDGFLPKPGIRFRLSRIVNDITKKVNVLLQDIKHDNFSYWRGPPSFDVDFHNSIYEIFASRTQIMDAIMAALVDSNVGMIGVYGWSGVGKTALVKEVGKEALKDNKFDVGIMVKVTRGLDTREIQGQIADRLGMKLEEESVSGRAARIRERLNNPKESTLVILDDLRVKLDFNMLGIPYVNKEGNFDASGLGQTEEPLTSYKGCKILVISDSKQLLLSQMDGKGSPIFHVGALEEKEADMLFKTLVEIGDGNSVFETLAAEIAKKCNGLPVTIVTTAMALKNKSLTVWKDANKKLEMGILTTVPELSTKLSYDLLENEELKHLFLICARLGHDALISDLVRYCIGLGLLQGIYTVREARDRVHTLVGTLKELNLLSNSFSHDRFTMQDVIRDVALSIASQDMHAFVLTKTKLDEWPDQDKLEKYTAISLHHCDMTDIIEEFPERINFSRLKVFRLDNSDTRLRIPGEFFNGMKELLVLILTGIHLSPLPSSIKCLTKLRMLGLEKCQLGKTSLSVIGELKKLRVLSLSGSDIHYLPAKFGLLAKLQIFDISYCFNLKVIPVGVLSSLTSLEELYMGNSSIESVNLSELRQLNQLTSLDMQIPNMTYFPKNVFFDKLDSYKIVIGDFNAYPVWDFNMSEMHEASRFLALELDNRFNIHSQKEIKILFERVENLLLGQLNDVEDIFNELNCEGFPYLKYLSIVRNSKVKSIINSKNQNHDEKAFPKLVSLFLYEVNNMEHICHSRLTNDSFCKLKIIKLKICGQLNNVFFSSMIKHLKVLETIEVSECNTLKGIVTSETQSTDEVIDFPELRSLTLHSLSEFIGFYTLGSSSSEQELNRNLNELFEEKVVVSKLERIELSSIKIHKIWSDQPLKSAYFQNLIQLDVNDCGNLNYLLSFSMAKRLTSLQSLFVSKCRMMVNIIKEEVGMTELQESIFPKLKIIKLSNMTRMGKIWHSKIPLHSFDKLDALIVEECNKLENVFPSYMMGRFQNLINLRVANCKSMKDIFDLKGSKQNIDGVTKLQNVHVEALPKLEHVWNKDPEGTLKFNNLQRIRIQECANLKNIFPISIATSLENLEYLEVLDCGHIKEIVAMGETINHSSISFEFPKLTTTRFSKLPNLESFYGGTYELSCSALNDFSVELCPKLELFRKQSADPEIKPVFLLEKVIYNLKSMQIEPPDAKSLRSYIGNYRMYKLEEFQLSGLVDTEVLYFFLHRNPNLKSLLLSNCFFKELVPPRSIIEEKSGVVPTLKSLKLINIPSLKMIGFEEDPILFQRLECLLLKECPRLSTIVPPSVEVSFSYLTNLEVSNCKKLSYLMEPSTAKSLVQLTTMKVIQCESMETIVSNQVNKELFIFGQLKEIELIALHKLESFCSSFRKPAFNFPSLEKFVVSSCSNMKSFTFSGEVNTPALRQICVIYDKGGKRYYWKGEINETIRHMGKIWALDPDKMAASNPYKALESFGLKTLKLVKCELSTPHAIPTAVFPSLRNLEELEVSNTNVVAIFDKNENEMKGYPFPLKKLTLDKLPNLERVWDQKHEGILCFQNLHQVLVTNCESLKTLLPKELAKKLEKLEKLEISYCEKFLQIVEEENATTDVEEENATTEATEIVEEENATTEALEEFFFPHLTSLHLCQLPKLTNFYPGRFTLECPDLYYLEVLFCGELEIFQSQQEAQGSTSVNRQPLFSEGKVSFNLESLKFDRKNTMTLCSGKFLEGMLHKLVELELDFYDDIPELSSEKVDLPDLMSIGLDQVYEKLQRLSVSSSPSLTTLVPSAVSFSNLKQLCIKDCHGLKHLFTSSTAKKIVNLEEMYIERCNSMEKIFDKQSDGTTSEAIKFERLNTIVLDSLSSLVCFYPGNDTLQLSSLRKVRIWQCPNMKMFTQGVIHAESFQGIQVSLDPNENLLFHQYLNATAKEMYQRQVLKAYQCFLEHTFHLLRNEETKDMQITKEIAELKFFENLDKKSFSGYHELQQDWPGKVGLQNKWLCSLVTLMLDKHILPYAIPSSILPYFNNLKELQVRGSNKVKVIFEMNDTEIMETALKLEKLHLEGLSELTRVWENNGQGFLSFHNLQHVFVKSCENLKTLFPAAQAKNLSKLKVLEIASCDGLLEIVGKEEDAAADVTEKFVFPHLTKLNLDNLPLLTCFYPENFTLECPMLNKLFVLDCLKLELFQSANAMGDANGDDCSISINRQPISFNLQDIANLEELALDWNHTSALNSRLRSEQIIEDLKCLNEVHLYFDAGENEKPTLPLEILQKAPNLKEMSIGICNSTEIFLTLNSEIEEHLMLGHLKTLTLDQVSKLQSIGSEDSLWLSTICEKLEELNIFECPDLTKLVHSTSAVSFSHLKELYISECPDLKYLFTSSAAQKLKHLEEITVKGCQAMKEIVAKENETTSGGIRFERLRHIYLITLSSLVCFYPGNDTLQLSSLRKVRIWQCPNMKMFTQGVIHAESFRGIQVSLDPNENLLFHQHLNATVKEMYQRQKFFENLDKKSFSGYHELQQDWLGKVGLQNKWLCSLVTLMLDKHILPYAIPSSILPYFNNLKELQVRDCNKAKVIFEMNDTEIMETALKLEKLHLEGLSELTRVWENNGQGFLSFHNLQHVFIKSCENLKTLFPAALAKNLNKLKVLEIASCDGLLEIVGKEEDAAADVTKKFVFPHLTKLNLDDLPLLTFFYPGNFTLECPMLNNLYVLDCLKLELFQSTNPMGDGDGDNHSISINRQPFSFNLQDFAKLEELALDWNHTSALNSRLGSEQIIEDLKCLTKVWLYFDASENEKPILPLEILKKAPNLKEMRIGICNSPEIFLTLNSEIEKHLMLGHLKTLTLDRVSKLQSIGSEDSLWLSTICEKLEELDIFECPDLTKLVHSTSAVSFSHLKELYISECPDLKYLFTSSAAQKLKHLEEITVKGCQAMKEIVAKENETTSGGIRFERLRHIYLITLSSLVCFYPGNDTLQLSSLRKVRIWQCPNMKMFTQGVIHAESFRGIQVSLDPNENLLFHQHLNATVKEMYQRQKFFENLDKKSFSGYHELQQDWLGKVGLQNKWLHELVTLKLSYCILPYAIPSCILPYLKNLKELEVWNSNAVKVVFDMKDTDPMETVVQLEKLHLEGLSKLTHVWEKNSQGVLMFQNLQHVIVMSCDNLETLFPAALAKNLKKLKELRIESCDKLLDIVEKEEDAAANVTENFVFPCLKILDLNDLPQFTCFYPQTFTLECPALNNLKVLGCPKLELFQSTHPEGEGEGSGTSITRQPHISYLKVISNLEELLIDWKHISALSSSIRSGQFTEGFKYLNDICLYFDDADENEEPILPTEVLQKAPNLKELWIGYCNRPEIIHAQNLQIGEDGMLGQLRIFTLHRLSKLQSIKSEDSSWLNGICEKLHELNVSKCPDLTTLIPSTSTVSFSCLRELHITRCPELQYLLTSSAAKKLMKIEVITVEECESMKKIVAKEDETTSEGIIFEQLRSIHLITLSSLECFYSGYDTMQLSSLIQVKILQCPKMEIFSQGLIHAESFRGIQTSSDPDDELILHEDLNTSVKHVFLLQRDPLVLRDSPMLKEIWLGSETVPDWCFRNLNSLVVESCEFLSNAILPSHLLPLLHNLRELQVLKCNSVKSIFGHSKMGSQGSQSLPSLEELQVQDCEELVEIVTKEEEAAEEANQGLIIFPSLISLKLWNLPNLRSIYFGMRMLEWPMLKELEVSQCQKLKFFTTEFQNCPDSHLRGQDSFQTEQQDIVSLEKVTPHLEKLSLGKKDALMIEQGKLFVDLPALNSLRLRDFHDESDEFPFAFCSNATFTSCLEQLVVSDSAFKEIFPSQTFNIEYAKIFSQLKELHIVNLSQLESIGLENPWVHPFLQNLEGLLVRHCNCLTNLTPSIASFSNLKELSVYNCHALKYLFTSSTAKTLGVLWRIEVTNCDSIEAIVAKKGYEDEDEGESEGDKGEEEDEVEGEGEEDEKGDEIIFGKLLYLTLDSLPKLKSFFSGSSTLNFPSLEEVSLTQCNMQVFSFGDVVAPNSLWMTIDGVSCEGDINSSIKQNIAMKRQPEKSLPGERSLMVSTHRSLDSSNNAKMEC